MDADDGRRPLLTGRGFMRIEDFCLAAGLDRTTAEGLVRDARVEGGFSVDGRVLGLFDDVLPTAEQLRAWGLTVRDDYDPELHRSYEEVSDDDDVDVDVDVGTGASWTMGWDESGT